MGFAGTVKLHPLHVEVGGRPTPGHLSLPEGVNAKDVFDLPRVQSTRSTVLELPNVTLIGRSLQIEHSEGAVEVDVKFAEVAAHQSQGYLEHGTPSLLVVMPEVKWRFDEHAFQHATKMDNKELFGTLPSKDEESMRRPFWILLVHDDIAEIMAAMSAVGAIRTDFSKVYDIDNEVIGKGGFGEIHIAHPCSKQQRHNEGSQERQAVVAKMFIIGLSRQSQRAKREAAALLGIGYHPNVVSFHGIFKSTTETCESWTLLLGYCRGGSLLDYMRRHGRLKLPSAKRLAGNILEALAHIHSMGYMHRDVKPENILLETHEHFVLADYGAAAQVSNGRASRAGTPGYIAPEILNRSCYTELVDLFSLGAVMHLCICGHRVFRGNNDNHTLKANAKCKIDLSLHASKHLNAAGVDFLEKLCSKEPRERPSARDALGHQWLKQEEEEEEEEEEEDDSAIKASGLSQALMDSSRYDTAFCSRTENEPKTQNRSKRSLFRSLLRRPGMRRSSTLTKVLPAPNEEYIHASPMNKEYNHPPHAPHARKTASGARESFTSRASKLMAWMRGKPKQQSNLVSAEDFTAQLFESVPT